MRHGFVRVTNGTVRPGALFDLVDLFGYVRETNYDRHFDVRTEINPTNVACTGLGFHAHTDNPYRDPVPKVQVLYCLESSAKDRENMVFNGFAAALRLQAEQPYWFDLLARYCARFEYAGAAVLERFFPPAITDYCRYHVADKRYLYATRPDYFKRLSEASVHSLHLQGGPITAKEMADFEKNPHFEKIIAVRYLDDAGKVPDMETPDFWHFTQMVQRMVYLYCATT